jgi:hypothetical protein
MPFSIRALVAALILLSSAAFAIGLVSPAVGDVKDGDTIDLGTIGPGQTISVLIDPLVTSGGIHGLGGQYDIATVEDLPRGWAMQESKRYQKPLQVTITADPDAAEGDYMATIKAVDEFNGEQLGNVSFAVKIHITYDVMGFDVAPSRTTVGPGQPARFSIIITNKGATGDAFDVSATGAKRWEFRKQVFVPAMSSKTILYEIVGDEEMTYTTPIRVMSLASSKISGEKNVTMEIKSDLFGDYRATNNGVVVFPIFESLMYSLAGLLSNLVPGSY